MEQRHRIPRAPYVLAQLLCDFAVIAGALLLAYLLRFDFAIPPRYLPNIPVQAAMVMAIRVLAMWIAGAHRIIWRFVGLSDLPTFVKATAISTALLFAVRGVVLNPESALWMPASVIAFETVLSFFGILGLRVARRGLYENQIRRKQAFASSSGTAVRVFLVGAGRAGALSVREMRSRGDMKIIPVGFIDDDLHKVGSEIGGVPVVGQTKDIPALAGRFGVDHVIITVADADATTVQSIVEVCESVPLKVRTIPSYNDLLEGKVSIRRIRDIQLDDLLGREAVELDVDRLRAFLTGRSVMVTGAGGSIGSELARQIARYRPDRLVLLERSEFALFEIERKLKDLWPELRIVPRLGDVCDESRIRALLIEQRPDVVLHAAAYKHVPMMERQPAEAVRNNIEGTLTMGELCGKLGVETFVLISTDKAVRPTSVMGASKRVAELIVQDLDRRYDTSYVAVRFGNVLGSTGSVVPIFTQQIARGGPVTVTHPKMTRYFMSIAEAAQLVLSAAALGREGEIFVLDMGEPVPIVELAEKMIRLSGFRPHDDIEVVFTGQRPGEKLFEELGNLSENLTPTDNSKIFIGKIPPYDTEVLSRGLIQLRELAFDSDSDGLRIFLNEFLPEAKVEPVTDSGQIRRLPWG